MTCCEGLDGKCLPTVACIFRSVCVSRNPAAHADDQRIVIGHCHTHTHTSGCCLCWAGSGSSAVYGFPAPVVSPDKDGCVVCSAVCTLLLFQWQITEGYKLCPFESSYHCYFDDMRKHFIHYFPSQLSAHNGFQFLFSPVEIIPCFTSREKVPFCAKIQSFFSAFTPTFLLGSADFTREIFFLGARFLTSFAIFIIQNQVCCINADTVLSDFAKENTDPEGKIQQKLKSHQLWTFVFFDCLFFGLNVDELCKQSVIQSEKQLCLFVRCKRKHLREPTKV